MVVCRDRGRSSGNGSSAVLLIRWRRRHPSDNTRCVLAIVCTEKRECVMCEVQLTTKETTKLLVSLPEDEPLDLPNARVVRTVLLTTLLVVNGLMASFALAGMKLG